MLRQKTKSAAASSAHHTHEFPNIALRLITPPERGLFCLLTHGCNMEPKRLRLCFDPAIMIPNNIRNLAATIGPDLTAYSGPS